LATHPKRHQVIMPVIY